MLFAWFMLGGLILLFSPQAVTSKFQFAFARFFRWPLSIGRNMPLSAKTEVPIAGRFQPERDTVSELHRKPRRRAASEKPDDPAVDGPSDEVAGAGRGQISACGHYHRLDGGAAKRAYHKPRQRRRADKRPFRHRRQQRHRDHNGPVGANGEGSAVQRRLIGGPGQYSRAWR